MSVSWKHHRQCFTAVKGLGLGVAAMLVAASGPCERYLRGWLQLIVWAVSGYVYTGGICCSELRKKEWRWEMGVRKSSWRETRWEQESKMLEKALRGIARREAGQALDDWLCRSLSEAVGRFPDSGSCVRRSAEGREQWAGSPSSRAVAPRAGNVTEKHMQRTCAATHRLFYTIPLPSYLLRPLCKPKRGWQPIPTTAAVAYSLISGACTGQELPCRGRSSSGCFLGGRSSLYQLTRWQGSWSDGDAWGMVSCRSILVCSPSS